MYKLVILSYIKFNFRVYKLRGKNILRSCYNMAKLRANYSLVVEGFCYCCFLIEREVNIIKLRIPNSF